MSTQVQYRRGTETQNNAFTGALGEITVDTTSGTLRVHDGITAGGSNIATVAYVTAQISSLSSNSITDGTSNVKVFNNGNVAVSVGGTANVLVVTSTAIAVGNIINSSANGTGNIGTTTGYFNTAFVKATSAQYADLAEMYVSDNNYAPGTVVEFGGDKEVTISSSSHSTAVAGIVSTNPSYLMNSTQTGEHVVPVALTGRVPCQVLGPVRKGDVLVSSSTPGVAQRIGMNWQPGCVVGKSMEVIDTAEIRTIEVAVGRL
jgi:hypothetical protein